jgi:ribosomal protein L37AE/L43A
MAQPKEIKKQIPRPLTCPDCHSPNVGHKRLVIGHASGVYECDDCRWVVDVETGESLSRGES